MHPAMARAQRRWRYCRDCRAKIYLVQDASGRRLWVGISDGKVH